MPKFSVQEARQYYENKQYGAAVANYMSIFHYYPHTVNRLEGEFLECFKFFCRQLESAGCQKGLAEINEYFLLLSDIFKNSYRFFYAWGQFLVKSGLHEEAALCFMKALTFSEEKYKRGGAALAGASCVKMSMQCELALHDLRDQLVDQWHFRMLNDHCRNKAYRDAISETMKLMNKHQISVLDIGAGTGILSMIAADAGAGKVYGVEHSRIMSHIARRVLDLNHKTDRIKLIEKDSSELQIPVDIPQKVDLVVAELMDAGFFGEYIVHSLLDAKQRLLKENGRIVPGKVRLYATVVECHEISKENVVFAPKIFANGVHLRIPCQSAISAGPAEQRSFKIHNDIMPYSSRNNDIPYTAAAAAASPAEPQQQPKSCDDIPSAASQQTARDRRSFPTRRYDIPLYFDNDGVPHSNTTGSNDIRTTPTKPSNNDIRTTPTKPSNNDITPTRPSNNDITAAIQQPSSPESSSYYTGTLLQPYDSTWMNKVKQGYRCLSPSTAFYDVDLNDTAQLEMLKKDYSSNFFIQITQKGRPDAVVFWFCVQLSEHTCLSNDISSSGAPCWEQVIFPLCLNAYEETCVNEGEILRFDFNICDNWFRISAAEESAKRAEEFAKRAEESAKSGEESAKSVTEESTAVELAEECVENAQIFAAAGAEESAVAELSKKPHHRHSARIVWDSEVLAALNDEVTHNTYRLFMECSLRSLKNKKFSLRVLDITADPVVPFIAARVYGNPERYDEFDFVNSVCVQSVFLDDSHTGAEYLLADNPDLSGKVLLHLIPPKRFDVAGFFSAAVEKIDVLLINPLDNSTGLLKPDALENIAYTRFIYAPSIIIPSRMDIWAMIVESQELVDYCRVSSDENTLGYKIKDAINMFDVEIIRGLEFSTLKCTQLTPKIRLFSVNFNEPLREADGSITRVPSPGLPHVVVKLARTDLSVIREGKAHALLFWYELSSDGCTVSINTREPTNRYKCAAYMLKTPYVVQRRDTLLISAALRQSMLCDFVVGRREVKQEP